MGKKKKTRNGYSLHEYPVDGNGYKEEYSDDEEDVFVEDASLDGLANASKPLMHPRQRTKVKSRTPDCKCRSLCKTVLYFLLMVGLLGGLVSLLLYVLNRHKPASGILSPPPLQPVKGAASGGASVTQELIGCDTVEVEDVWVVGFPKLLTESAFRLVDVSGDGVLDVILGFATGADGYGIPQVVCDIYFNSTHPCYGGIMALEGATGRELWRHYSFHEVFALNCNVDLDGDKVPDCLGAGRAGAFQAVSGRDGSLLWNYGPQESKNNIMNVYTPSYISDIDNDHVPDLVVAHGGDPLAEPGSPYRLSGRLLIMSGRTGEVITWVGLPDEKETYYSTQVYPQLDATPMVLFGSGGETHSGSLWVISLDHLMQGKMDMARPIYTDKFKGVMTPPVLIDLTGDGVLDIVIAPFNSTVIALDGHTYDVIWNYTFPLSETYSTPAAGYYNDDDIPDFLVKFAFGPGFPVYYRSQTTVLDGKTGKPLLQTPIMDSVGAQASALTISMEGKGHDLFLYWLADCLEHEGQGGEFHFIEGTNVHEQSRSDFCRLRFKTRGFSKLMAFGRNIKQPGATVYFSEQRAQRERQDWVNTTAEALAFLKAHPEHLRMYERYSQRAKMMKSGPTLPSDEDAQAGRRKGALLNPPTSQQEGYNSQYLAPALGAHSPGAKKGPQLQPQRGGNSNPPQQYPRRKQQQQPPQQQQPAQPRQKQFDKYQADPFASDMNNPYGMADLQESLYPRRGQASADQDDNLFGYPAYPALDQQDDYSRYYPKNNYAKDRYGSSGSSGSYGNRYQPYGNSYQKRDYDARLDSPDDASDLGSDYGGRMSDAQDLLLKLVEEAGGSSRQGERNVLPVENSRLLPEQLPTGHSRTEDRGSSHTSKTHALNGEESRNLGKPSRNHETKIAAENISGDIVSDMLGEVNGKHQKHKTQTPHAAEGNSGEMSPKTQRSSRQRQRERIGQTQNQNSDINSLQNSVSSGNTVQPSATQNGVPATSSSGEQQSEVQLAKSVQNHKSFPQDPKLDTERNSQTDDSQSQSYPTRNSVDDNSHSDVRHSSQQTNAASPARTHNGDSTSGTQNNQPSKAFHSQPHSSDVQSKTDTKHITTNKRNSAEVGNKQESLLEPMFMKRRKRKRRHVGPHDDNGLQRLLSTGTVAPSTLPLTHPDYHHTMEVVFATYWFFPAKTQAILPRDQKCIADKLSQEEQRFDPKNKYYGMDHDAYEHTVTDECMRASDHQLSDDGVYESQTAYNPYETHMGQMTVYRLRLKCTCSEVTNATENKRCARMMPFDKQQWPAYMGRKGDSYWLPRT